MARTLVTVTIVILSLLHQGAASDIAIKDLIVPEQTKRSSTVTLECISESKKPLIYIKWSHNEVEFLKFQPEQPNPFEFHEDKTITIDRDETTGEKVVLKNVDLKASGNYTCIIVGQDLNVEKKTKVMTVVEIPDGKPSIEGDVREQFNMGDIVNLTCTTPPSFPAATLSWFINNHKAPDEFLHEFAPEKMEDGLFVSRLRLTFTLSKSHFNHGELKLKCVASIARLYTKTNEHSQQEAEEVPVKEVRTLPEEGSLITTETNGSPSVWGSLSCTLVLHSLLLLGGLLLH